MAPIFMNMLTPARVNIRSGARWYSTTTATKSETSWLPTPCSGSINTTLMGCGWMLSLQCFTSTIAVSLESGSPTSTGVGRILKRLISCVRGIDRLAYGVLADLCRRLRLQSEVEHGLDA